MSKEQSRLLSSLPECPHGKFPRIRGLSDGQVEVGAGGFAPLWQPTLHQALSNRHLPSVQDRASPSIEHKLH